MFYNNIKFKFTFQNNIYTSSIPVINDFKNKNVKYCIKDNYTIPMGLYIHCPFPYTFPHGNVCRLIYYEFVIKAVPDLDVQCAPISDNFEIRNSQ